MDTRSNCAKSVRTSHCRQLPHQGAKMEVPAGLTDGHTIQECSRKIAGACIIYHVAGRKPRGLLFDGFAQEAFKRFFPGDVQVVLGLLNHALGDPVAGAHHFVFFV